MKAVSLFLASSLSAAALPSVGPNYIRPATSTAAAYQDAPSVGWKTAEPADMFSRGEWWKLFSDPTLNDLELRGLTANQDLRAAAARLEEAAAQAGIARGAYWPEISFEPSASRVQASRTIDNQFPQPLANTFSAPIVASWELDLFGRVRRLNESARNEAAATAALFESVRLSLTAEIAENYFTLRGLDQENALLRETIDLRHRELDLVSSRYKNGAATDLDRARAETELAVAEADSAATERRRQTIQHALAVLVGESAPLFTIQESAPTARTAVVAIPDVPAGLPSDLLERRPDVAAAERSLAATNAQIGVAKAAFFPAIALTGSAGFASNEMSGLFHADSRAWSIGPSLYLPIFQGGRNRANLARSRAAYDESVAHFRGVVLVALREVQDALTATTLLANQSAAQERALVSARRAAKLAQTRYDAGFVSYLEVIDAQRTALATERVSVQLAVERYTTSVTLIKALGGGWHRADSLVPSASHLAANP